MEVTPAREYSVKGDSCGGCRAHGEWVSLRRAPPEFPHASTLPVSGPQVALLCLAPGHLKLRTAHPSVLELFPALELEVRFTGCSLRGHRLNLAAVLLDGFVCLRLVMGVGGGVTTSFPVRRCATMLSAGGSGHS